MRSTKPRTVSSTAHQALALAQILKQEVKASTGVHSVIGTSSLLNTTNPLFYNLNLLEDGTGNDERHGDEVRGISIHARICFYFDSAPDSFPATRTCRCYIYRVKAQINGTHTPTWTDVFNGFQLTSFQDAELAIYDRNKMGTLIEVLFDEVVTITTEEPFKMLDIKLPTPYRTTYDAITLSTDLQYQNVIIMGVIPCGPGLPSSGAGGPMRFKFLSNYVFNS